MSADRNTPEMRPTPGLAFSIVCDVGFAVGLMTIEVTRVGDLVWIAKPTFDQEPTVSDVEMIEKWRWPVFFPLGGALRRKIVTPIGIVGIPTALRSFPLMRSGNKRMGWMAFTEINGVRNRYGRTADPSLPIYKVVNDTRLKEMIVTGWMPESEW